MKPFDTSLKDFPLIRGVIGFFVLYVVLLLLVREHCTLCWGRNYFDGAFIRLGKAKRYLNNL